MKNWQTNKTTTWTTIDLPRQRFGEYNFVPELKIWDWQTGRHRYFLSCCATKKEYTCKLQSPNTHVNFNMNIIFFYSKNYSLWIFSYFIYCWLKNYVIFICLFLLVYELSKSSTTAKSTEIPSYKSQCYELRK